MTDQQADLEWRDTASGDGHIPVSRMFDDPYYSLEDGAAETAHVFLDGNDLPTRYHDGFHIAELGFGTGLNFLVALAAWRTSGQPGKLRFTSFEAYPMTDQDRARALVPFTGLAIDTLSGISTPPYTVNGPDYELRVIIGDARDTLTQWGDQADAWFLDGFSPAKNPELWGEDLMAQVAAHTAQGGSFATYTAAGFVRRGLEAAGFDVQRTPGFGRKRHMARGVLL